MYVQGYFSYDAHKSGGVTVSHLRFGKSPIKSQYLIQKADYVACHFPNYVAKYGLVDQAKDGGVFVLNCRWTKEELDEKLPGSLKRQIAAKKLQMYIIDAEKIAVEVKLGRRINMIMQTVFFKLAKVLPFEQAVKLLKEAVQKTYGNKGEAIVKMNWDAIDKALEGLTEVAVPAAWKDAPLEKAEEVKAPAFITDVLLPQLAMRGGELPVSKMNPRGVMPMGTTKYEKRGIAQQIRSGTRRSAWRATCAACTARTRRSGRSCSRRRRRRRRRTRSRRSR